MGPFARRLRNRVKVAGGKWRFEEATPKPFARRPTLRTQEMRRTRALRRATTKLLNLQGLFRPYGQSFVRGLACSLAHSGALPQLSSRGLIKNILNCMLTLPTSMLC
jgi:hypothetical protein